MGSGNPEVEIGTNLKVKYNDQGLVPAIIQDIDTKQILMMGWMNDTALELTLKNRKATFYSRSRNKLWVKGETSGHVQEVIEARVDCDQDVVLLLCKSHGPACHVGFHTCFYRAVDHLDVPADTHADLKYVETRVFDPEAVYKSGQ